MKNRIKLNAPALKSRAQAEDVLRQISELTLSRNQAQLDMDAEITRIREQYKTVLSEANRELEQKTELVRAWAEANLSEFKGKSLDTVHAVIGWRTGQPALKTLSGWTWDRVMEKIKGLPNLLQYIRTKEEVNKQALLADREGFGADGLRLIGLKVLQEESFYVEPKLQQLETRQQTEAA